MPVTAQLHPKLSKQQNTATAIAQSILHQVELDEATYQSCASSDGIQKQSCEYIIRLRTSATEAASTQMTSATKDVKSAISRGPRLAARCRQASARPSWYAKAYIRAMIIAATAPAASSFPLAASTSRSASPPPPPLPPSLLPSPPPPGSVLASESRTATCSHPPSSPTGSADCSLCESTSRASAAMGSIPAPSPFFSQGRVASSASR